MARSKTLKPIAYIKEADGVSIIVSTEPLDYAAVMDALVAEGAQPDTVSPAAPEGMPPFVAVRLFDKATLELSASAGPSAKDSVAKYRSHYRSKMPVPTAKEAEPAPPKDTRGDSGPSLLGG